MISIFTYRQGATHYFAFYATYNIIYFLYLKSAKVVHYLTCVPCLNHVLYCISESGYTSSLCSRTAISNLVYTSTNFEGRFLPTYTCSLIACPTWLLGGNKFNSTCYISINYEGSIFPFGFAICEASTLYFWRIDCIWEQVKDFFSKSYITI